MPKMQIHSREQLIRLIQSDPRVVERAIVRLYERSRMPGHDGIGLNAPDTAKLEELYGWIVRKDRSAWGRRLFPRQHEVARQRVVKYADQLLQIMDEDAEAEYGAAQQRAEQDAEMAYERWLEDGGDRRDIIWHENEMERMREAAFTW